jgi:RHS repeat-associated protein
MKLARLLQFFAIIFATSALLCAQTAPNTENGFKSFGSYTGSDVDTVNLQNGNLMVHIPLFSYPQRGGLGLGYSVQLNSKNWQVGEYYNSNNILSRRWMLAGHGGLSLTSSYDVQMQRVRTITTDINGFQSYQEFNYGVRTPDGAVHWLEATLANGNKAVEDGSGFQFTLIRGTLFDHSDDTGVLKDGKGNTYYFSNISMAIDKVSAASGTSANVIAHVLLWRNTTIADGNNTVQTFNDVGVPISIVDADGNTMSFSLMVDPVTGNVFLGPAYDSNAHPILFNPGNPASAAIATTLENCVPLSPIGNAFLYNFSGPNNQNSPVTICFTSPVYAPTFSQANVEPPHNDLAFKSYPLGANLSAVASLAMPDGTKWAFTYDAYGNITEMVLPTGGTISYQWQEIPLPVCGDGEVTAVSRAVSSRTVNDFSNPLSVWQYTWGPMQPDGTITNYVKDPNGNETAHVFQSPVASLPCALYEIERRSYQGNHQSGTLLKTVDTHYLGHLNLNYNVSFAANVVADTITTTLPGNKISKIVRQYDGYPANTTFQKVIDEKVYDYGTGAAGPLLRETATSYQWQADAGYLNAGFLDLPASVIVTDSSGCKMAETDYAYDEAAYPNVNYESMVGALPAGTHQAVSTPRGNLTTTTRKVFDHSQCSPAASTNLSSHTKWYDTGEPYQHIDPLGHTTALSYDLAYGGTYATQTCSPQTSGVNHCVSGTYDFLTGLLESFSNENATTQASGNTAGDSGHTSSYGYDPSWRLTSATAPPDPGNGGASAQTLFTFSSAAPFTIQRQRSITTAMSDVSTTYLDAVGRPYQVQHAMPGGPAKVDTVYDGVGQPVSVSNPYFTTSDATYGVTQSQYDGLGRATQITKQDGSISTVSFTANCTTTQDEAGNQRRSCSDALGRLIEVDEPGVASIGAQAQTTVDIGAMKFVMVGGHAAANATGSITISGVEQVKDIPGQPYCAVLGTRGTCLDWEVTDDTFIYDNGTVGVLVNGQLFSYAYSSAGDSVSTIANSLAGSIRASSSTADYSSVVVNTSTTPPTATIFLTARNAGAAGNSITLSVSATTYNTANFAAASFNSGASGAALMGGIDAYAGTQVTDSGNVSISVGSFTSPTVFYGLSTANNAGPQVAAALAAALAGSGFTANVTSGSTVLTIKDTLPRVSSNGLTVQVHPVSSDPGDFPVASFNASGTLSGGVEQVLTALGNVTLYQYDGLGNLLCVEQHGGVTGTGCSALPASDASSPWRVRRFTYDSLSRLLTASNPESGTVTYSYDADGNLLQKTSPAPNQTGTATQTVSYCYDALNRVTGKGYGAQSCPLATPVVTYVYDSGANAIGKLTSLTDQAGRASYTYDGLGRLAAETRPIAGVSKSTSYTYNLDGSVRTLTYPSNRVVTYTPDSAGRVISAADGNGTNYVTSASYNPDSSLKSLLNGSTPALDQNFQYTPRLQLCRITALTSGSVPTSCTDTQNIGNIMDRGYDFHAGNGTPGSGTDNGNVFAITNYRDTTRSQAFTYDALNRLTSGWSAANTGAYSWGENYSIDAWGNLQIYPTGTKAHGGTFQLSGNAQNRPTGMAYDAAGNLMSYVSSTYTYDQENRLSSTAGMSYTYDGNGERVLKSNTSTGAAVKRYWSMGGNTLAEDDGSGNLTAEYIYFGGKRIARIDLPANTVHYYLSDHLGSTSIVASAAGAIEDESDYYPFGTEVVVTGPGTNELKFTGKRRDPESQLDYFNSRYFESPIGRFMSSDPLPWLQWQHRKDEEQEKFYAWIANPQNLNRYTYVNNNPLNHTDPTGMNACGTSNDSSCKVTVTFTDRSKDKNGNYNDKYAGLKGNGSYNAVAMVSVNGKVTGTFLADTVSSGGKFATVQNGTYDGVLHNHHGDPNKPSIELMVGGSNHIPTTAPNPAQGGASFATDVLIHPAGGTNSNPLGYTGLLPNGHGVSEACQLICSVQYQQFLGATGIRPSDGSPPQQHFSVVLNTRENQ